VVLGGLVIIPNNAILKCEDLIKNIQMAYNFVTLLIYPLNFFFKGVFNFVIQEYFFNLKKTYFL
jgi:hypothetical protein